MKIFSGNILLSSAMLPLRRVTYGVLGFYDRILNRPMPSVFILCYHSTANADNRFSMDVDTIINQIDFLLERYTPATLADVRDFVAEKKVFNKPAFVITFDDGYESLLALKDLPVRLGVAPTVFVLSDPERVCRNELGSSEALLTDEQLKILHQAGWNIGCHSATHPDFSHLAPEDMDAEIADAKKVLEEQLGFSITSFAYPKGSYTQEIVQGVQDAGFLCAVTMDDAIITKYTSLMAIPRIGVDKTHNFSEFKLLWSPSVIWLRNILKRIA